jgi:hypothetical protein
MWARVRHSVSASSVRDPEQPPSPRPSAKGLDVTSWVGELIMQGSVSAHGARVLTF